MKRGRKPTPAHILRLHGNPGRRPIVAESIVVPAVISTAPAWLDRGGRAEWDRLRPLLRRSAIVAAVDLSLLAGYCDALSRAIVTSRRARKDRRLAARVDRCWDSVRKLAACFAIGPVERSRAHPIATEPSDDTEQFLFGRRRA